MQLHEPATLLNYLSHKQRDQLSSLESHNNVSTLADASRWCCPWFFYCLRIVPTPNCDRKIKETQRAWQNAQNSFKQITNQIGLLSVPFRTIRMQHEIAKHAYAGMCVCVPRMHRGQTFAFVIVNRVLLAFVVFISFGYPTRFNIHVLWPYT